MKAKVIGTNQPTFVDMPPVSSNLFFHEIDDTGTTENPKATKIPIHSPYPKPPLHHPFIQEKKLEKALSARIKRF